MVFFFLKIESINKGKAFITITANDISSLESIYVHNFGLITVNNFLGRSNGDIIIPICIACIVLISLINLILKYRRSIKANL